MCLWNLEINASAQLDMSVTCVRQVVLFEFHILSSFNFIKDLSLSNVRYVYVCW